MKHSRVGCSLVVDFWNSMYKALGSIPQSAKRKKNYEKKFELDIFVISLLLYQIKCQKLER